MSEILLFTGPHGAGKDSVEKNLRANRSDIRRITRHITRLPADGEIDGVDYHFVSRAQFRNLIDTNQFAEWAEYPDVLSGTTYQDIEGDIESEPFASLTLNFEDAMPLRTSLEERGYITHTYFISPVDYATFSNSAEAYTNTLEQRMEMRGRAHEYITNKLAKAVLYRSMYADYQAIHYIANLDSRLDDTVEVISHTLDQGTSINI